MKLIQCANNHYYDSDKFSACPYCAQAGVAQSVTMPFGRVAANVFAENGNSETMITQESSPLPQTPDGAVNTEAVSPAAEPVAGAPVFTGSPENAEAIQSFEQALAMPSFDPAMAAPAYNMGPGVPPVPQLTPESFRAPQPEPSYQAPWPSSEDSKTVSYFARNIGIEPVVGWLVAIGGKYFGEDFRLKSGRNFIGRSPEMDIQLSLDISVSRRKHAIIVYEPKSRIFIAQPGDSRELFYLNDKVVLNSTEMKDRDIITIGETKLMLIALCNEAFSWEDQKDN